MTAPIDQSLSSTLELVATLRCCGPRQLHRLAYGDITARAAEMRTRRAVDGGFLQRTRILGLNGVAYYLTEKARRSTLLTSAMSEVVRRVPAPDVAFWALQRASLWSELTAAGWGVGCSPRHQLAVRRFLLRAQKDRVQRAHGADLIAAEKVLKVLSAHEALTPSVCLRCKACGKNFGTARRSEAPVCDCGGPIAVALNNAPAVCVCRAFVDAVHSVDVTTHAASCGAGRLRLLPRLPFDVATKGDDVTLLIVDDPRRSTLSQVNALPLRVLGQPRLPVILRPSDDDSIYDAVTSCWLQKGSRFRFLERLFSHEHVDGQFPFSTTTTVVDFRPETSLRVLRARKRAHA